MSLFTRFIPFIFLGIFIVLLLAGMVLFSYLLMYGALVGLILFVITGLRDLLFNKKNKNIVRSSRRGRTIDQNK